MVVGLIVASQEELAALQKDVPAGAPAGIAAAAATAFETTDASVSPEKRERILISPVARKLAEDNSIDISRVSGTGPHGRIIREDIERALAPRAAEPTRQTRNLPPEKTIESMDGKRVRQTMPLKGMRGAIAERMHRSLAESAQLTAMGEIDMTQLTTLRNSFVARENNLGTRITYTDVCVFVAAQVLREMPIVNSSILGDTINLWDDINIGIAVGLQDGLIVPVIRNADRKSLIEISEISKSLAEKARAGKLVPDDVTGGTFTITNLGAAGAGYRFETSIINPPESAVLGIGGISDRAVVRDGLIVIRPIMTYGFTYDHRVIDGTTAVRFMARVTELLENPGLLVLSLRP
jgi:pyruvate dehydrogenase E2 component (dihydrolipoamide acetyltransferase)/2-oxoglutarate dehydrogenase E2 component (dihydrolipoamide succinyltransferase)